MTVDYPTKNGIINFADNTVYLRADDDTVYQYLDEICPDGYTDVSYEPEKQRFSNDGGLAYVYYEDSQWKLVFDYRQVVASLTYTPSAGGPV